MMPHSLVLATDDLRVTPIQLRIYNHLHTILVFDDYREVKRLVLAHRFKTDQAAVSRYLGDLVRLGYLRRGPDSGDPGRVVRTYQLAIPTPSRGASPTPLPAA